MFGLRIDLAESRRERVRYYGSFVGHGGVRYLFLERIRVSALAGRRIRGLAGGRAVARAGCTRAPAKPASTAAARHSSAPVRPRVLEWWMQARNGFRDGSCEHELEQLGGIYSRVVDDLLAQPLEFLHGEFHCGNILIDRRVDETYCVRAIDWEMAAVAPPLIDWPRICAGAGPTSHARRSPTPIRARGLNTAATCCLAIAI